MQCHVQLEVHEVRTRNPVIPKSGIYLYNGYFVTHGGVSNGKASSLHTAERQLPGARR